MNCPVCNTTQLVMADRQGIEIDYCPNCRGVWLDRGELDRIIERSVLQATSERRYDDDDDYREAKHHDNTYPQKRKRKSWLEDIFDF